MSALLPPAFADLEPFAAWGGATETARNRKRIRSEQHELEAFAAAMMPRMDAICAHVDALGMDALPEPSARLFCMLLAVAEIAPSVEGYRQPTVPDGYDFERFRAQEGAPLRPRY